jgi:hypothetical protein
MITDPRTTPTGRVGRIVFGSAVGVMSTVLLAPWETEFGAKVGILSGLLVVTAARPFVEHRLAARSFGDEDARRPPRPRRALLVASATAGAALFVIVVAIAGAPNRSAAEAEPAPPVVGFDVDPASLPSVSIDDDVAGLSAELATQEGAQQLAAALAFNLAVEAEAMRSRDASLLSAVAHGRRLDDLTAAIEGGAGSDLVVPTYRFERLHLSIVFPGGAQSGANAGLAASGTVSLVTYSPDGSPGDVVEQPFDTLFSLRELSPGRWLTTDTPAPSSER